ncbi:hypothetical protein PENTCL1PPCAC_25418, partial [Pristionchus entomophagus]
PSGDPLDLATISLRNAQCRSNPAQQCLTLDAQRLDLSNYSLELPQDMPVCGFAGELCEQTSMILVIIGLVAGLAFLSILFFVYRRLKGNEIREMVAPPGRCPRTRFNISIEIEEMTRRGAISATRFYRCICCKSWDLRALPTAARIHLELPWQRGPAGWKFLCPRNQDSRTLS